MHRPRKVVGSADETRPLSLWLEIWSVVKLLLGFGPLELKAMFGRPFFVEVR